MKVMKKNIEPKKQDISVKEKIRKNFFPYIKILN